jgi:hypothetical protein
MRLIDDSSECHFLDKAITTEQKENQSLIFFSLAEIFRDSELRCAISRACEHVNPREMATVVRCS